MKTKLLIALASVLMPMMLSAAVTIDPAKAVIVAATKGDQAAAQELKTHLDLITESAIPIAKEGALPAGRSYVFRVGALPPGEKGPFALEESRYLVTKDGAWFFGGPQNGAQNGVYSFLEDGLGVRWPSDDDIAYTVRKPLVVEKTAGKWIPVITYRQLRRVYSNDPIARAEGRNERVWKIRLRTGTNGNWNYGPGDAVYAKWWKQYGKEHPEFFAMNINGVRGPAPSRLNKNIPTADAAAYTGSDLQVAFCCTNDALLDEVVRRWDKKYWLNFFQPDLYDFEACYCDKCRALDGFQTPKGERFSGNRLSDRYVHMYNRLYQKAVKYNPDVKVITGIYNACEQPPVKTKVTGNICFSLVPTDFTMEGLTKLVDGWNKAGLKSMYYRPNRHIYFITMLPTGYEEYFFRIFQKLYKAGAEGFDYDCAFRFLHNGQWFADYVILKGLQDPTKDFAFWEKHYMESFTGAEKEIGDYYRYWRKEVWEKRLEKNVARLQKEGAFFNFGRGLAYSLGAYYKESDFDKTDAILQAALSKKNLPKNVRQRIQRLVIDNQHCRLTFLAITKKSDAISAELMKFREKHGYVMFPWSEQYWGDICGLKRVAAFREYTLPYKKTPLFWNFKLDPQNVGVKEQWYKDNFAAIGKWGALMATNNCWEKPHKHYKAVSEEIRKQTADYNGIAWYSVPLEKFPLEWKDRRVYLFFGAVDESCWVYVNGKEAGKHIFVKPDDWRTSFAIDITDYIDWKKSTQIVTVRVEDSAGAGGIWKEVWLLSKDAEALAATPVNKPITEEEKFTTGIPVPVYYKDNVVSEANGVTQLGFYEDEDRIVAAVQVKDLAALANDRVPYLSIYFDTDNNIVTGRFPRSSGYDYQINVNVRLGTLDMMTWPNGKQSPIPAKRSDYAVSKVGNVLFVCIPKSKIPGVTFASVFRMNARFAVGGKGFGMKPFVAIDAQKSAGVLAEKFVVPATMKGQSKPRSASKPAAAATTAPVDEATKFTTGVQVPAFYKDAAASDAYSVTQLGFYQDGDRIVFAVEVKDLAALAKNSKPYMSVYFDTDNNIVTGRFPRSSGYDYQLNINVRLGSLDMMTWSDGKQTPLPAKRSEYAVSKVGNVIFVCIPKSKIPGVTFAQVFRMNVRFSVDGKGYGMKPFVTMDSQKPQGVMGEKFVVPKGR